MVVHDRFYGFEINIPEVLVIVDAAIRVHNRADGGDSYCKFMRPDSWVS